MSQSSIRFEIEKAMDDGISKLIILPRPDGLQLMHVVEVDGDHEELLADVCIPLEDIGRFWAQARTLFYRGMVPKAEDIMLDGDAGPVLVKLGREKLRGREVKGERSWLRVATGTDDSDRKRFFLGDRDLVSLDLAFSTVVMLSRSDSMAGSILGL